MHISTSVSSAVNRAIVTAFRVSWQAGGKPNLLVSRTALAKAFVIKVSNPGAQPIDVKERDEARWHALGPMHTEDLVGMAELQSVQKTNTQQ